MMMMMMVMMRLLLLDSSHSNVLVLVDDHFVQELLLLMNHRANVWFAIGKRLSIQGNTKYHSPHLHRPMPPSSYNILGLSVNIIVHLHRYAIEKPHYYEVL